MNFTRRNLLRALGLAGPAYFLPSLTKKTARAAGTTIPTRILFFYTPHGMLFRQWVQPPAGASAATETNFALGPILQPLQAFKNKLLLLEGFDFQSEYVDPITPPTGHIGGQTHALSATNRANATAAGGISIDELIAQGINSPAPVTVQPSLQLSARYNAGIAPYSTSWAGSNALVPALTDPSAVYALLFPNGPPTAQTAPAQSATTALAQRRKSILDSVLAEFNAVKAPLSATDQAKLDSHATLIRNLEATLSLGGSSVAACSAPAQATITAAYKKDCPYGAGNNCIADAVTAFTSLAVAAFGCDLTRVITFDIDQLIDSLFADNPAVAAAGGIHGFLHGMDDVLWYANDKFGAQNTISAAAQSPTNIQTAVKFYATYAQYMANLLQQLDSVPESDGSTLLDHTIVVWCGEIGSPNHRNFMVNYVVAGGGATGSIKTGRYVSLPRVKATNPNDYYPTTGIPHNNFFVSLANAMGLSHVTTFGNPNICTGPLTQLQG